MDGPGKQVFVIVYRNARPNGPGSAADHIAEFMRRVGASLHEHDIATIEADVATVEGQRVVSHALQAYAFVFFWVHNLNGLMELGQHASFRQQSNFHLFSVVDTVWNKIDRLQHVPPNSTLLCVDRATIGYCKPFVDPRVHLEFSVGSIDDYAFDPDAEPIPWADRPIDVLYCRRIRLVPMGRDGAIQFDEIARLSPRHHALLPGLVERAFRASSAEWAALLSEQVFGEGLDAETYFLAFRLMRCVRARRRYQILEELHRLQKLSDDGVRLHCVLDDPMLGHDVLSHDNLTLERTQPWSRLVDLFKRSKIVVNSMPLHAYAINEYVTTAPAHGALVFTDPNPFLEEHFLEGENIRYYGLEPGDLGVRLRQALTDGRSASVAAAGRRTVLEQFSLASRLQRIAAMVVASARGYSGADSAKCHAE